MNSPLKKINPALFIFLIIIFCARFSSAQDYTPPGDNGQQINLGFGLGMDYGGFGMRFTGIPDKHLGIFLAAGYNLGGIGFNFGASYRFTPDKKAVWYYTLMYGYNAVIVIENASEYNEIYYGPTTGVGVELHSKRKPGNFWNLEFLVPIRSQKYQDDIDDLKHSPFIELKSEPAPVAFSVGYHFAL